MSWRSETLEPVHLNSVWLEGTVLAPLARRGPPDPPGLRFRVRAPGRPGAYPEEPSEFLIEAAEGALGADPGRVGPGRTVRVIGRLREHRWRDPVGRLHHQIQIVGELVEPVGAPG